MHNSIKYIYHWLLVIVLAIFPLYASAQRTMPGQSSIQAEVLFNGHSFGAGAAYGQYTLSGYWTTAISFNDYRKEISTGDKFQYEHLSVKGGYMFRIAGTVKRDVNLYGGCGAFIGCELMDPFGRLPFYIETNTNDFRFLYGIYGGVCLEIFVSEKTALIFGVELPVNFSSVFDAVHYQAGIGCRFLL